MLWKNGCGETTEILTSPPGASLDAFDWRISMAHVEKPGSFSHFPGIDRTLAVVGGAGLTLKVHNEKPISLRRRSDPFGFSGESKVDSDLIDGPIHDLNVMTNRNRFRHCVSRCAICSLADIRREADIAVVVAIENSINIHLDGRDIVLSEQDSMVLGPEDSKIFVMSAQGNAELFLIHIWPNRANE